MSDPKPPSEGDEQQEQEKWYERTRYQILLFLGGILGFVLVVGFLLDWYIDPQGSAQKKGDRARRTLPGTHLRRGVPSLQGAGAALGVAGATSENPQKAKFAEFLECELQRTP